MFNPIHKHLIIKAKVENVIDELYQGDSLLLDIVDAVGMVAVTEPQVAYVKEPGNEGLTGSINLATSHVAFHVWDKQNLLMLDVYSCKDFDVQVVLSELSAHFGRMEIEGIVLDRENWTSSLFSQVVDIYN